MSTYDVLIVGGGHAGAQAAIALRQRKFAGSIANVGDEAELPYERPPLSKEYLSGDKPWERLLIRPATFWSERDVTLLHGRVTGVDAEARTVMLAPPSRSREGSGVGLSRIPLPSDTPTPNPSRKREGDSIGYHHLIWATGGRARRLSCAGHDFAGVHTVRSRADVDRMIAELPATTRVCVVGGGYIGLEAASVLRKLGKAVTLVEAQDRVLARVAGPALSRFFESEHRAHGVDLRLRTAVDSIVGADGRATGVRLTEGEVLPCDMVVVGIGILPETEPLLAAGAAGGNGVAVDAHCRTTLPDVYAVGDCALHHNAYADGTAIRLESVANANDMATVAARAIAGDPAPYDAVPWFWSNQYDLKLQTVGLSTGHDTEIVRGDPATRSFSTVYLRDGRVVALDCVNAVRDYVQGRGLLLKRADPALLADAGVPLKEIAAS